MLLQIAAMRRLLSVFSGNELDIGITLAVWLAAVGAGSYAGGRIKGTNAFAWSFAGIGLLSQQAVLTAEIIRPFFLFSAGEVISLPATLLLTTLSLAPLCFVVGLQFPLAVSCGRAGAAVVYGLDTIAAFAGGMIFTFVLAGRIDMRTLAAAISVVNLTTGFLLINRKYLLPLLLLPIALYVVSEQTNASLNRNGLKLVERIESRYGDIRIMRIRDQLNLYSAGKLQFSYPDPQTEELRAHVPMSVHPSPSRVLVIGGSPAVLREFLKYPVSHIDFVETDPAILAASFRLLSAGDKAISNRPELRTISEDAGKFIKNIKGPSYDLIVSNLPEPSTANLNRFYTTGFFREADRALNKGGILCLNLPVSSGYIGRRTRFANGSVYGSLRAAFGNVKTSSEEYGYFFASADRFDIDPKVLKERFAARKISAEYFRSYLFDDIFAPLKVLQVEERLRDAGSENSDARPVSYLYNLMLWAEINQGKLINNILDNAGKWTAPCIAALFLFFALCLFKKRKAIYFSMFTTGYSAMSFSLLVILAYQSAFGHVYETIGILTGSFMLGAALGSAAARKDTGGLGTLLKAEGMTIALFIFATLLFRSEHGGGPAFYIANLLCGLLTGVEFSAAAHGIKDGTAETTAGKLYSADMAGSFLGSLSGAILLVPLLGLQNMLLFLVSLKMISLILLTKLRYETN